MEDKQASYYMVIPAVVWNSDLPSTAKLLYGHITVLANKKGYCFATNSYLSSQLGVSKKTVSGHIQKLEKLGVIESVVKINKDTKVVEERKIYLQSKTSIPTEVNLHTPTEENLHTPMEEKVTGNTTSNNNTSNNTNSKWDKLYQMLVEGYPKNRIQSKNPVIKLLKDLDKDQIALILKNKERYLKASNGYVKNLRKYIEEECWSEEWLNLQESTNKTKNTGTTTNNTKTFGTDYGNF